MTRSASRPPCPPCTPPQLEGLIEMVVIVDSVRERRPVELLIIWCVHGFGSPSLRPPLLLHPRPTSHMNQSHSRAFHTESTCTQTKKDSKTSLSGVFLRVRNTRCATRHRAFRGCQEGEARQPKGGMRWVVSCHFKLFGPQRLYPSCGRCVPSLHQGSRGV